jgi:glycosyltransferase involved in cell wall biosynthesis
MDLAAAYGLLNQSVYFIDPVPESELVTAAQEADIGLIPYQPVTLNNALACPNKLSQYMHAGLMIVSTNLVYIQDVIDRYSCGLTYASEDPRSLVETLKRAIEETDFRAHCQQNALKYSKEDYNWQRQSTALSLFYD